MASRQKKKAKLAAERVEVETVKTVTTKKTLVAAESEEHGETSPEKGPEVPALLESVAKVPSAFAMQGGADGETPGAKLEGNENDTVSDLPVVGDADVKRETAEYKPVVAEKPPELPDARDDNPPTADDLNAAAEALGDKTHIDRTPPTPEEVAAAREVEQLRQAATDADRQPRAGRPFGGTSAWLREGDGASTGVEPGMPDLIEVAPGDEDGAKPEKTAKPSRPQIQWWAWVLIVLAASALFGALILLKDRSAPKKKPEVAKVDKPQQPKQKAEAPKPESPKQAAKAEEKKPNAASAKPPAIVPAAKPAVQEVAKAEPSVKDLPPLPEPAPKVHVEEPVVPKPAATPKKKPWIVEDIYPALPGTTTSTEVAAAEKQEPKPESTKKATKAKTKQKAAAKAKPAAEPKKKVVAGAEQTATPPTAKPAAEEEPKEKKPQRARQVKRDSWADDLPQRSVFAEQQEQGGQQIERDAYEAAKRDFPQLPPAK